MHTMRREGSPRRLLVVVGSKAFGDVIEAFPVFDLIRELWPATYLAIGCQTNAQQSALTMYPHALERIAIRPGSVRRWKTAIHAFREKFGDPCS